MLIKNSIDIRCNTRQVFYWLKDPAKAKQWMTSVKQIEILHKTPNLLGTIFREVLADGNRETEILGTITEYKENKKISFYLESEFHTVNVCFTLVDLQGISRLEQRADVRFKGVFKIFAFMFGSFLKRTIITQTQSEFSCLKELCEQNVRNP